MPQPRAGVPLDDVLRYIVRTFREILSQLGGADAKRFLVLRVLRRLWWPTANNQLYHVSPPCGLHIPTYRLPVHWKPEYHGHILESDRELPAREVEEVCLGPPAVD
jgi:hypothetical protein